MTLPAAYLVVYEVGNDYHCGCCRRTWTEVDTLEFDSPEAAVEYAENVRKGADDRKVTAIYKLLNEKPVYEN